MSLHHAAQQLSAQGRGPDTTLVHMSKDEVKSLNDVAMAHGGQLTINPKTGLPEAGFLSKMLPMVIGAGLAATGVGAPVAALMVGGGYAAATGDIKKGLMAGLGAYGGAGIGSALSASGAAAAPAAAPAASLGEAAATVPAAPVVSGSPLGGIGYTPTAATTAATSPAFTAIDPNSAIQVGSGSPMAGANIPVRPVNAPLPASQQAVAPNSMATGFRTNANQMFEGAKSLGSPEGRAAFMKNLEAVPGTFGPKTTLAAAAAPLLMPDEQKQETPAPSGPGQQYTYSANPTNPFPTPDPYGREQRYFNPVYTPRMADGGMARGGISDLGDYSDGGRLLRGPGDGVSDSIPAMIGEKQPARLADGEFVVPARIVSELGNGSTEAGARKLYAMMDRIQKARGKTVGKGKVAKNSRAEKHLPA